ncbi:TATA element modulatory factor 1 [Coemansia sp. RSA 353]|nr:TATA element modulatory factor 1 [Coemansia sp. RSA 562]KAJ2204252.1 TATA element modulatory factor 1 [Coemansia sp. RSA 521]KAJ2266735.1 TATA element modulatory factor 1 [Coemansia sp. RSA 371]KAJ2283128.1 TATA element modulatory factor 1 [Coemansia sp. RSA 370]KAJ2292732.1 TATA element modulatory factor 1 [Coemansia sp. RSA 353]
MNSLFGGGPAGAGRPASGAGKPAGNNAKSTAPANDDTSASPSVGGWGGMFKSALNQMESHLDRYLELPQDGQPGQRVRQASQPPRSSSRQASVAARVADSSPASVSRLRSSASSSSLARKAVSARVTERAHTPLRDTVDEDVSTDLLDAFGVELDDERPSSVANTVQRVKSSDDVVERILSPLSQPSATPPQHNEFDVPSGRDSEASDARIDDTRAVSVATPEPVETSTVNPYIQAELKKLREATVPSTPDEMRKVIEEHSKRIEALLIEGQAWSAKELRLSNTIKKLRSDNKGLEKTSHMVQKKLELTLSRNDELSEKLKRASMTDRSSADSIKTLKSKAQEADVQRRKLEYDLRVAAETRNSLKTALTSAEGEITALRAEIASTKAQQTQAITSAQTDARIDADQRIAQASKASAEEKQRLQEQVVELQQRMLVVEEGARDREVSSLTQIRTLRAQLRNADAQSRDIGGEIQQHTLPLLQQIEELQSRQTTQRNERTRMEEEWAARVRSSAKQLEQVQAELQTQVEETEKAKEQVAAEGKRIDSGHKQAARLEAQLKAELKIRSEVKQQLEEARATIRQLTAKLDTAVQGTSVDANSAASSLSPAVANGTSVVDHTRSRSISSVSSIESRSRRGSSADSQPVQSDTSTSASATHGVTKKLSSQVTSLKAQLQTALRQKDEYSRSLVDLSIETEKLRADAARREELGKELETLKHRHETALEMLGEKTEELMDLQSDMEDMRKVYKQQLESLVPNK